MESACKHDIGYEANARRAATIKLATRRPGQQTRSIKNIAIFLHNIHIHQPYNLKTIQHLSYNLLRGAYKRKPPSPVPWNRSRHGPHRTTNIQH
jgi:hypothetical protein